MTFPAYPSTNAEVRARAGRFAELRSIADADPITDFPLADLDHDWDYTAAEARVRAFTAADGKAADADPTDAYKRCFFGAGIPDPQQLRLLFCDVVDDTLVAVPAAIRAWGALLHSPESVTETHAKFKIDDLELSVPLDARNKLQAEVGSWYLRVASELDDDTFVAPWVAAAAEARAGKMLSARNIGALGEARDHAQAASDALQTLLDAADDTDIETTAARSRPSFVAFFKALEAERATAAEEERDWDWDDDWDVYLLTNMISMASSYMVSEDEGPDADDMRAVMTALSDMLAKAISEASEPPGTETNSSESRTRLRRRLRLLAIEA